MPTVADIRNGLAENLRLIPELQIDPYLLGNPTPPSATILPGPIDYDGAMGRGMDEYTFTVQIIVGVPSDRGAQIKLDTYIDPTGPNSVKAAVESDPTLSGVVDDLHVVSSTGYRQFGVEGRGVMLGCEWTVNVITSN